MALKIIQKRGQRKVMLDAPALLLLLKRIRKSARTIEETLAKRRSSFQARRAKLLIRAVKDEASSDEIRNLLTQFDDEYEGARSSERHAYRLFSFLGDVLDGDPELWKHTQDRVASLVS